MDAAKVQKSERQGPFAGPGELVLQNGRQAGARRLLGTPLTFVGRAPHCDIRLNVDGVDPLHCLVVETPDGMLLRDLQSIEGTFVNGVRVDSVVLQNGDLLKVGPFQFRLESLAPPRGEDDKAAAEQLRDALRAQAAAVAAQQAELDEQEERLDQRQQNLREQEAQLAAHLAEKQKQVQLWSDYTRSERDAMRKEKITHEKHLEKLENELADARAETAKEHERLVKERQRVERVYQRLRQRWQKQWAAEREKHQKRALAVQAEREVVDEQQKRLEVQVTAFNDELVRFNTERELSRREIVESRDALRREQERARERNMREHHALSIKGREIESARAKMQQMREMILQGKDAWRRQQESLRKELVGLNDRIIHHRLQLQDLQGQVSAQLQKKRGGKATAIDDGGEAEFALPEEETVALAVPASEAGVEAAARTAELEKLTGELADHRTQLLEQYSLLAHIQDAWQRQRNDAADELDDLARRLMQRETELAARQAQADSLDQRLSQREHDVETIRQEVQIWRGRLKSREQSAAEEHAQLMQDVRARVQALDDQLGALAKVRLRWNQLRQQELASLRESLARLGEDEASVKATRLDILESEQRLEDERRSLKEKAIALEQYRQECFERANDPTAQKRLERLRRRWLLLNAAIIRNAKAEREQLQRVHERLASEQAKLAQREDQLARVAEETTERLALADEREAILAARQLDIEHQRKNAENLERDSKSKMLRLEEEVDSLAKAVYDEQPASDQAA